MDVISISYFLLYCNQIKNQQQRSTVFAAAIAISLDAAYEEIELHPGSSSYL